jgi:hypothetical protein
MAGLAFAASPVKRATYDGKVATTFYYYPGPTKTAVPKSPSRVRLHVSKSGHSIASLRVDYPIYCGSVYTFTKFTGIAVKHSGSFGTNGSYPSIGPNGQANGTAYVKVGGKFLSEGRKVRVSFTVVTKFTGNSDPKSWCSTGAEGTIDKA